MAELLVGTVHAKLRRKFGFEKKKMHPGSLKVKKFGLWVS
jgi:hypothetical protein